MALDFSNFLSGTSDFLFGKGSDALSALGDTASGFDKGGLLTSAEGLNALASVGGGVGSLISQRKGRKAQEKQFNKLFDFNKANVDRTNRLEDERQKTIDDVFSSSVPLF